MRFTISARGKPDELDMRAFLATHFADVALEDIDSVFGFVERSTLYGGRIFRRPELTPDDVAALYEMGIGLRLPLTNHFVDEAEYEAETPFLQKYHRDGNAVICTNDDLAKWIRRDFPRYRIEASVIKNLKSYARIERALELHDTVVLPMELNVEDAFLRDVPEKARVTLFGNAGCAFTCPSKTCYVSMSRANKIGEGKITCSQTLKDREMFGMIDFDLERLQDLGFSRFKMLRARHGAVTGY